jgi:O-antigen/teichoic acid export membrane protein
MDNRMKRAGINAMSTVANQLVVTIIGIIVPWVMISNFGSIAYGATTSIAQFLGYITLFEGGIGRVARGALYKPLADGNNKEISRVYYAIKRFFAVLGIAFIGYTLILAFGYYEIADVSEYTREYIFALVIAIAIGKFAEYMGGITNITLLNADQRQYVVNAIVIFSSILNVALIVILANSGVDILWVKLVSSFVFVLKPILFTIYVRKKYRLKKTKEKAVLKNKITGMAQHVAYVVQNSTDVLILTVLSDLTYVAVYSVYNLIASSLRNITTSFTGGMEAVFGNMIAKDEHETLLSTYRRYKFILTVLTVALFGTATATILPFVAIYTWKATDADYLQPTFAIILLLSYAINCVILPCFNLPIAANQLKKSQWGAYTEAGINLVVSCVLVFWNPLIGVAVGTLVSSIFKSIYYIIYSGKNILKIGVFRMLFEFVITILVLTAVSVVGMIVIDKMLIDSYIQWILCGIVTVIIMGAIGIILGALMYPDQFKSTARKLLNKIH